MNEKLLKMLESGYIFIESDGAFDCVPKLRCDDCVFITEEMTCELVMHSTDYIPNLKETHPEYFI